MKWIASVAVLTVAGMTGGCALAPVAALGVAGNVADIGNAAFTTGTEVFNKGRLESIEFCTLQQGETAIRWMLNDLRLTTTEVKTEDDELIFKTIDDEGAKIDFELLRRTPAICQFRVDVGWFGSEAYARLLLKSIRGRLPATMGHPTTLPASPIDLNRPQYPKNFQTDEPG